MIKLDVTDEFAKLSLTPDDVDPDTFSFDHIVSRLQESGVRCGIIDSAIEDVLEQVGEQGRAVKGVVVARRVEPQAGRAAEIEQRVKSGEIAAAGDVIAELGEPTASVAGETVRGDVIAAPEIPVTVLAGGANTKSIAESLLRATVYGTVKITDKAISVEPLVRVQPDGLAAHIDVHAKSSLCTPITLDMLFAALEAESISYGVNAETLRASLDQARASDSPLLNVIAAEGKPAVRGTDGRLEEFLEMKQAIGERRPDGSIDYRERSIIRNVKSGVRICRSIPPTPGEPKIDVYARATEAEFGHDIVHSAGENVEQRGDEFWSTIDGAVMIRDNVVSVSDVYSVPGDIDLKTGNLRHEKGAILVSGAVRSGFTVHAASHIIVNGLVEDATLESGANIEIGGGVLHASLGSIRATGDVAAKFAQNAKIVAGGSIMISGSAMSCDLHAGSRIIISGKKGGLVGGVARASQGIQVRQLGGEAGVPTRVEIDLDHRGIELLKQKIAKLRAEIAAGGGSSAGKGSAAALEALMERMRTLMDATETKNVVIEVEGIVYSGVSVTMFGAHYHFTDDLRACRIHLNEQREIEVSSL
jgi:hypothetical protein